MKQTVPFVITISRQLGSGGTSIGQEIAKRLNIHYLDREIIRKTAEELSVLEEDLDDREERLQSLWESFIRFSSYAPEVYTPSPHKYIPTQQDVFAAESKVIEKLANEESAVVIGRCGFHVLRNHPNHLSIYLHCDEALRSLRIQKLYKISAQEADEKIAHNDKERGLYIKNFTGKNWSDAQLYDLTLNTGKIPLMKSVDIIMEYVQAME